MLAVVSVTTILSLNIGSRWAEEAASLDRWMAPERAVSVFEEGGIDALRDWVSDPTNLPPGQTIYVLDDQGRDFLDRDVVDISGRPWTPGAETSLPGRGGRPVFDLRDPDGSQYVAFLGRGQPQILGVLAAPEIRQTVIPIALLASALACFLLSKYLIGPIARIANAAQELEQGDLSQRANLGSNRSDEIGILGRQFDAMAEKIERNEATRNELFRNLSHEFRTPLARIQLAIELARREPANAESHLNRIGNETVLLENMTRQMLALARMQFSDPRNAEEIDIIEIVNLVVEDAGFEGMPDNKQIRWSPPEGPVIARGDPDLFRSAIENVVRNAIQYTPAGSVVSIESLHENDQLCLKVSDQGRGVSEANIADVFEPFRRADSKIDGVGIGLAITRQVITSMGGNRHREKPR